MELQLTTLAVAQCGEKAVACISTWLPTSDVATEDNIDQRRHTAF